MTTDYQKQASDFLAKHGLTFSSEALGISKHFDDDKEPRARYMLTLTRFGTTTTRVSFEFAQSIDGTKKRKTPTVYDLLACLTKYDPGTHKDFCSDFGYDPDSRKGLDTYLAVQEEWQKVRGFFRHEEIEELGEIN